MATATIGGFSSLEALSQERDSTGPRSPEGLLDFSFLPEVAAKPLASQTRHFLQGSRLLKQMGCARDNLQMFFRFEFFISLPIEFDDYIVEAADDQQSRGLYTVECRHREVRPAAARYHRADSRHQK